MDYSLLPKDKGQISILVIPHSFDLGVRFMGPGVYTLILCRFPNTKLSLPCLVTKLHKVKKLLEMAICL